VDTSRFLLELYTRIPALARGTVEGLTGIQLTQQIAPDANTIAWLVWHVARVQDHHVGQILGTAQLWETGTWASAFGLDDDPSNTGYGHGPRDVRAVRPESTDALCAYLDAVSARTASMLRDVSPEDLDRIVDRAWDPPVTLGVRLASIAADNLEHVGQAAYVRGILGA
jgi:hypothetical protein